MQRTTYKVYIGGKTDRRNSSNVECINEKKQFLEIKSDNLEENFKNRKRRNFYQEIQKSKTIVEQYSLKTRKGRYLTETKKTLSGGKNFLIN